MATFGRKRCKFLDYKLILDTVIILLLVATIGYAVMLNRQLKVLRHNREELAKLISTFNEATLRAEAGVPKLRRATEEAGQSLQEQLDKASVLQDDLAYMIERADAALKRMDRAVPRSSRVERSVTGDGATSGSNTSAMHTAFKASRSDTMVPAGMPRSLIEGLAAARIEAAADDGRSETERDLLRALQSIR